MSAMKLAGRLQELAIARSLIPPKFLTGEPKLLTKKWFDYRFLSPLEATLQFGAAYREGVRKYVHKNLDRDLAHRVEGVNVALPSAPTSTFTQLWTARQRADEFCIPYEELIEFSFAFAAGRQRLMAPTPIQLHANPRTEYAWNSEFEKFKAKRPSHALYPGTVLPQYHIEHDRGLPAQTDFREALASAVSNNPRRWSDVIARYHLVEPQLSRSMVSDLVPEDVREQEFEKAESEYDAGRWGSRKSVTLDDTDFFQSCFGMQEAQQAAASDQCSSCPHQEECRFHTLMVDAVTDRNFGSVSPIVVARRAAGAARVAKHRAKKAALLRTGGYVGKSIT
ncbi:hypothetical protein NKH72_17125 [Mesorhizobium sp. M0955]|uniref:hypothetical protein n=1 Tax=Mesorhizobium sp. M0955 TaxID=2957033 RepID=UPI00333B5023